MAKSNRDRVSDVMDALKIGLAPFVIREFNAVYGKRLIDEIVATLGSSTRPLTMEDLRNVTSVVEVIDTQGWLKLIQFRWDEVFRAKLAQEHRSYVNELIAARNKWAHQEPFATDDAYRVADTATRLLQAVNAVDTASETQEIAYDLMRLRFKADEAKAVKKTEANGSSELTTRPGLKPWRMVVQPHPDVARGQYAQAEFAADLAQVLAGTAQKEYSDPVEFFRRTYLTQGLLDLLTTGIRRLCGEGGDPVVQLQTSFGGGKSHSMIALYHLVGGGLRLSDLAGGDELAARVGNIDLPVANRAVLVGTALKVSEPRQYPDATVRTLWGEMAYQLGGVDGYRIVESADVASVNPGSDTLVELLEMTGPNLVIIDELVAYARNVYGVSTQPSGSFDSIMSFIQSLTEAVKRASDSLLLISIPQSKIEIGGDGGFATLEILANTIGRIESVWKPVSAVESFEVVRRRLFASEIDYAARDAVITAFMDMYTANRQEFPSSVSEMDYRKRMTDAYPIHPELFDRLYQDWSTLERFQRTRGVLRLMAAVIHALWVRDDQSLLIMPGSVPLDSDGVKTEMLHYLPEGWSAIVDTDIDGPQSRPYAIDGAVPSLGRYQAARRVARTIFIGSAPSVAAQSARGIDELNIRLGVVQPGEQSPTFGDALKRMRDQLTYLYSDPIGNRYWYDTHPTVNKMARDRAQAVSDGDIEALIVERLKKIKNTADIFTGVHAAPLSPSDVADEQRTRAVVMPPDARHKRGDEASAAIREIKSIFEYKSNGTSKNPRIYRNTLVFIAPDESDYDALQSAVRDYLAWKSIDEEQEFLNLDAVQRRTVKDNRERADGNIDLRLQTTYSWLIVPEQPDPTGPVRWEAHRISGEDSLYLRAMRKIKQSELIIGAWSPDILRQTLDAFLWRDRDHITIKQLWDYLTTYVYLPRLRDQQVLLEAIQAGIGRLDAPFGYATGVDEQGNYTGLAYRRLSAVFPDAQSVVVRAEVAAEYLQRIQPTTPAPTAATPGNGSPTPPAGSGFVTPSEPAKPKAITRYYGAASLDAQRPNREFDLIVDEIIERLTSLTGCEVDIRVEISARRPDGFDEATLRTINENSRTLKFDSHGFEAE